jgi:hypothetical protein
MNAFVKSAVNKANITTTTNGMTSYKSTTKANLDFFGRSGNINYEDLVSDFKNAYAEDPELAIRNVLHMRDIRGGKGVRDNFRNILSYILTSTPSVITYTNFIKVIPEIGRWDDLFSLVTNENKDVANQIIKYLASELMVEKPNPLLCKWLPRKGIVASKLRSYLKLSPKQYRQILVKHKNVVETTMCNRDWSKITYQHVPSRAMNLYSKAFARQDDSRFAEYIEKVNCGEVKINAAALFPHEIVKTVSRNIRISPVQEAQWKNIPNLLPEGISILPMIDVSASMTWSKAYGNYTMFDIAVAMGVYLADKGKSDFKDMFLTFSSTPELASLSTARTLENKIQKVISSNVGGSTNIEAAFKLVLKHAITNEVLPQDMPDSILILSDMQFNSCVQGVNAFSMIESMYRQAGYSVPKIIFWNLTANSGSLPVTADKSGAALVSGYSPASLTAIFNNDFEQFTPENIMLTALNNSRYNYK